MVLTTIKYFHPPKYRPRGIRGGVLPYLKWNGDWLFAVGIDSKDGTISNFAGKIDDTDTSVVAGAFRELDEESLGIFSVPANLDSLWVASDSVRIKYFPMEMVEIFLPVVGTPEDFQLLFRARRVEELAKPVSGYNPRLEMSDLVWITGRQLLKSDLMWRPYQRFLQKNVGRLSFL